MNKIDFYTRHYRAVINEILPSLGRRSRKILAFWNSVFRDERVDAVNGFIDDEKFERLKAEIRTRIAALDPSILDDPRICPISCLIFHEPDRDGTIETIRMAGGFDIVKRAIPPATIQMFIKDRETGEEFLLKEVNGRL